MPYRYLITMLTACAVLAASAGGASAQDAPRATATFSRTDVRVVEASTTTLEVRIAPPEDEDDFPRLGSGGQVVLEVEPAAVVTTEACSADEDADFALRIWSETEVLLRSSDTGAITIDRVRGAAGRAAAHSLRRHVGLSGLERHAGVPRRVSRDTGGQRRRRSAGPHPNP